MAARIFPGWTVQRGPGGCGDLWAHTSGWHVEHCGHPTANWPYSIWHCSLELTVVSHNGMGFRAVKEARAIVEAIAQGDLAITTGNCCPGIARTPGRTAMGSAIPEDQHAYWGRMQGVWTKRGLAKKKRAVRPQEAV